MKFEQEWVQFFREQYPIGSRIRLREPENKEQGLRPGMMGTLKEIDDDGRFTICWDNGNISQLMPGRDSFRVQPPEAVTMKLYMPLQVEVFRHDYWGGYDDEGTELTDGEILEHEAAIVQAMTDEQCDEETERGIMHWYGEDDSLDEKVRSVFFTAEERDGKLWGVAKCRIAGELTSVELEDLKDYISGQASDGWGEGFEQREIQTDDGDIYVHLWNYGDDWSIQTEDECFGCEMEESQGMTMAGM